MKDVCGWGVKGDARADVYTAGSVRQRELLGKCAMGVSTEAQSGGGNDSGWS